ncbi:MAG: UvrD-helicase domain-containing protein [Rhodospirillales bacterium]|jgi:DNA helicase-2/ATP-dependent DNA helicase PcrA|nr:UvrD-helicase domain-containing protein [Rhodospirillales bacterium]MDP7650578.1 UvrD-helicase domain-containing protein [Rhodospirillales bacterium]HJO97697.1 UvrD-helicase domain-containing protein [Rhodospirillales bacterium]
MSGSLDPHPSAPPAATHLDGLNESQLEAVETTEGPVLVLAGAGTGKTRVLISRLSHILLEGKARPMEMLAVTFTNKAAREMKDRVAGLLGRPVEGWWIGTFHALSARILRSHAEAVGLRPNFTILDTDDQERLLKQLLEAEDIDLKKWPPRVVLGVIQRWKDRGLTPDKVTDAEGSEVADGKALVLYAQYQERLKTLNAVDFGDLLLLALELFQDNAEVLDRYQRQFRYILVDEYQDTNVAQYLWLRLLARSHSNLCCVGDDDQSIYSWRGAEVGNILRFESDFPGARIVRLERNYRSTPHILGAASGLIANNQGRLGKTLWTEVNEGEKVRVRGVWDGAEEARLVGDEIEALHAKDHLLDEMAVLVRAGFQTREFEERLITLGVPYRIIGGPRFYERMEIRDAIAYFRIIVQPSDDLAFERIVNVPRRGLGAATLQTVHRLARAEGIPLTQAVRRLIETDEIRPRARGSLARLMVDFERWRSLLDTMPHAELAGLMLDESGYTEMWKNHKSIEAPGRLDNLRELVVALAEFDTMGGFLEHVSLVMENDDQTIDDKVNLMTLHGAKGLEFETVFLPGWEEGLFPYQRALDEEGEKGLEEERRLAYVGLTRARHRAIISFAASRRIYNQWQSALPSRFIDELPADCVDHTTEPGLYGGQGGGEDRSWRRRQRAVPHAIPLADATWLAPPSGGDENLATGQRVFHQKFGYGRIVAIDGDKAEIDFEKAGHKKVMTSFVTQA